MFAYAFMPAPEYALLVALLHGLTFSAMWVAAIAYATEHTPPGLGATVQGLLSAMSMSLASMVGGLIGGLLYGGIGPATMFGWAGVAVLGGLLFFAFAHQASSSAQQEPVTAVLGEEV